MKLTGLSEVFMTATDYARLRGVTEPYVHQLRRSGRLVVDECGRIAMRASDDLIASTRLRPPRRGTAGAAPGHPWAKSVPRVASHPGDTGAALGELIASAMWDAASALAPHVAEVTGAAECRSYLAQTLARTGRKITAAVLAYHRAADATDNPANDAADVPQERQP